MAAVSLRIVLTLSFLVTRLATAALTLTGVSQELARLQAVSAFTGVGFTTMDTTQQSAPTSVAATSSNASRSAPPDERAGVNADPPPAQCPSGL